MARLHSLLLCLPLLALSAAQTCNQTCGTGGTGISSRIVNGVEAPKCDWGWLVSIRIISDTITYDVNNVTQTDNYCNRQKFMDPSIARPWSGGVIVGDRWVLTSGRALMVAVGANNDDNISSKFVVVGGEYDISKPELLDNSGEPQEQIKFIESVHFQDSTYPAQMSTKTPNELSGNSLVLLKLKKPFVMNECVRTVCLPDSNIDNKKSCYIAGWGFDRSPTPFLPSKVLQAKFDLYSADVCEVFLVFAGGEPIQPGVRCATAVKSEILTGTATCVGDQGGPLVCDEGTPGEEKWVLYGSVLIDTVCNGTSGPTLVSDVAAASSWITDTMAGNVSR